MSTWVQPVMVIYLAVTVVFAVVHLAQWQEASWWDGRTPQ
jgi:hypothetical protein